MMKWKGFEYNYITQLLFFNFFLTFFYNYFIPLLFTKDYDNKVNIINYINIVFIV
jgi:hypothetical protein